MRQILGFIGIQEIEHVQVNRQGPSFPDADDVLESARSTVLELAAPTAMAS
jgi:FMN-dependent NADH-azoreductase